VLYRRTLRAAERPPHLLATALAAAGLCAASVWSHPSFAHAVAGARVFVPTLTLDDPGVADEASLPTIQYQRSGAAGGPGPTHETDLSFEYDKRITENFGLGVNDGWSIFQTDHAKTQTGFPNLYITAKYEAYVNAEHEFIASVGIVREFGGTATLHTGGDRFGSTAPTLYVGKGFGDLPIGAARALGVTGELSYSVADIKLKGVTATDPTTGLSNTTFNNGANNQWSGGISLQYSMSYLKNQVKDFGLPDFVNRLVPALEVTWSSPSGSPSTLGTQILYAPAIYYMADDWDIGLAALIPGNKATGTNVGAIAQFHIFLDDVFPNSIGKPLF
jgi:hypothetical protein